MLKFDCDYDCVVMYKKGENQKEILTHLWKKYQPLVKKVVRQHFRYRQTDLEYEDCIQNCYFCFPQVMNKLVIKKIKNKELFSFGACVKLYLQGYTQSSFKQALNYYSNNSVEYCESDGTNCVHAHAFFKSRENVERDFETREIKEDFKNLLYSFLLGCDERERTIFQVCVEKNTAVEKKKMLDYVSMAFSIKKGYHKKSCKQEVSKQYYFRQEAKLKRKFISHMQQHGYYSKSSLRSVGLEKFI